MRVRIGLVAAGLLTAGLAATVAAVIVNRPSPRPAACMTDRQQLLPASVAARASEASIIAHRRPPALSHIVVIIMENRECGQVIGSPSAPYLTALAHRYAQPRAFYGTTHPSLPNYLALTSGLTFGFTDSCSACSVRARNMVDEFEAAGISWKAYMQGMPNPCYQGQQAGLYRRRHDPFMFYDDIAHNPARCQNVVPLTELGVDEAHQALPQFAWISPDLCNDMHNCTTTVGDKFLSRLVPPLLKAVGPRGLVIITWDEGDTNRGCCSKAAGGNIPTILAGPTVSPGLRSALRYDGYSILRTIEDSWGLPRLGWAACRCTPPMTALFRPSLTRPALTSPG